MSIEHNEKLTKAIKKADKSVYATQLESNSDNLGYSQQAIEIVEQELKEAKENHTSSLEEQRANDMLRLLKETQAAVNVIRND
ncbi:hypothetical protein AB685_17560 [Bacillus sp. LL01]|uniref:hypothetical protein n=1 Tax=Bacillus sp. LL01 TaxID=1665556 RepID=UPI00064D6276|nr:hypothetical protein [Bacillus sp. LL01]KMJ57212.1 hypothetical protein AB685_17560 [Bacillus sp. LL01]